MTAIASYFSDWKTRRYTCECGWSGTSDELARELFDELLETACPVCDRHLLLVSFPTKPEIQAAAAAGDLEAKEMLTQIEAAEAKATRG